MLWTFFILIIIATVASAQDASYEATSPVVILTAENFEEHVLNSSEHWIVEFYAPWCGHCKSLKPAFEEAAGKMIGQGVRYGAVDCTVHKTLMSTYGVKGFPTIKGFAPKNKDPVDYNGARSASALMMFFDRSKKQFTAAKATEEKKPSEPIYTADSPVVALTAENFEDKVLNSSEHWIVEFYAPWCGHCKSLKPEYEAAAKATAGTGVNLGAVDCTAHRSLMQKYGVKGFPTIKGFAPGAADAIEYQGGRTAKALQSWYSVEKKTFVQPAAAPKKDNKPAEPIYLADSPVIALTEANFEAKVLNSTEHWIVEFYAPWCGHCKSLKPEYEAAAKATAGTGVNLGAVDCTVHRSLMKTYGVKGFPTIKGFAPGVEPVEYKGGRTASALSSWYNKASKSFNDVAAAAAAKDKPSEPFWSAKSDVVQLTEATFEEMVLQSKLPWLVEFYAPWCGHCKAMKPAFEEAASKLYGKVRYGAVDATENRSLATKFGVKGFPTLKGFYNGEAIPYEGGRTASDLIKFGGSLSPAAVAAIDEHVGAQEHEEL